MTEATESLSPDTPQAVKTLDKMLLLAQMAASLAARWTKINTLLAQIQSEGRQPTDEEFAAAYADYDQAREKLLGDAALIEQATGAGSAPST